MVKERVREYVERAEELKSFVRKKDEEILAHSGGMCVCVDGWMYGCMCVCVRACLRPHGNTHEDNRFPTLCLFVVRVCGWVGQSC